MRDITIEMACSINGIIAKSDGNEDFLLHRNWEVMLEFLKEYDVLVWGNTTFKNVIAWGEKYLDDLKDTNIIVLSRATFNENEFPNVTYCNSLEECINLCEKREFNKIFISGGAHTNTLFMKNNLVNHIIINYNPYVINQGINLFEGEYFEKGLILNKIVKEEDGIVQVHYDVKD
jgi:dihydrofolate reductase